MKAERQVHEILMDRPCGMTVQAVADEICRAHNTAANTLHRLVRSGLVICIRGDKHLGLYFVPEHEANVRELVKEQRIERRRERERNRMRRRNAVGTSAHEQRMAVQRAKRAAERALLPQKPAPVDLEAIIDPPIIKRTVPVGEWMIELPIRGINSVWALAA